MVKIKRVVPKHASPNDWLSSGCVAGMLDCTLMTIWRWTRDPAIAFPEHEFEVNRRRFWRRRTIEAFQERMSRPKGKHRKDAPPRAEARAS